MLVYYRHRTEIMFSNDLNKPITIFIDSQAETESWPKVPTLTHLGSRQQRPRRYRNDRRACEITAEQSTVCTGNPISIFNALLPFISQWNAKYFKNGWEKF